MASKRLLHETFLPMVILTPVLVGEQRQGRNNSPRGQSAQLMHGCCHDEYSQLTSLAALSLSLATTSSCLSCLSLSATPAHCWPP